jgi:hypothetical protein
MIQTHNLLVCSTVPEPCFICSETDQQYLLFQVIVSHLIEDDIRK